MVAHAVYVVGVVVTMYVAVLLGYLTDVVGMGLVVGLLVGYWAREWYWVWVREQRRLRAEREASR